MRRTAVLAAGGAGALLLIVIALWASLPWLLETWGARWIGGQLGIPAPRFTVAAVSASRLELRDLRVGEADGPVSAESATLTFDLAGRRLGALIVNGARIEAAWRNGTLVIDDIGPLDDLFGNGGDSAGGPLRLPMDHLRISGARLLLRSPLGLVEAVLDATAAQQEDNLTAEGNLSATGPGLASEAAFALHAGPGRGDPWLGLGGHAQIDITARDAAVPGLAQGIDGYANITVDAQPGGIRVTSADGLSFTVRTLEPGAKAALPATLADALAAETEAGLTAVLGGLGEQPFNVILARHGEGMRLSGSASASVRLGTVTGRLGGNGTTTWADDGTLSSLSFSRAEAVLNGFPAFGGRVHASLLGHDLDGRPEGLTMQAEAYVLGDDLSVDGATVPRLRVRAAGPLAWDAGTARAGLVSAHVEVDGPATLPGVSLPQGLSWDLTAPDGDAVMFDQTTDPAVLRLHLAVPEPALVLRAAGHDIDSRFAAAEIEAALPLGPEAVRTAALTLHGGQVRSGELAATAIEATLREGPEGLAVEADAQVPLLPGEVAPLPEDIQTHRPLRLRLTASRPPGQPVLFSARAREGGLKTILSAEGRHDPVTGKGRAAVRVPRLTFGDALQPEHLYAPLAAAALRVEGDVAAQGTVSWTTSTLTPRLEVLLDGLTVQRGFIVMRQMHGVATLTQVWPPRTPGDQVLAIAAIDAGVPFTNAETTYRLDGKGNAIIADARMTLAGGSIHADPFTLPFDAEAARTVLHMRGVRLDPLVELADLGGLTATGTLSGDVPVELRRGNVLFHDGTLESQEPGTIRYRPEETPGALAGGGAGVDLMLQALDDFHYKSLRLSLSGSAGGDLDVGLHVAGANPALYDGYPLEFNLTLSGALAQIIEGSLSGYQVPDRIRRQLERFGVDP